MQNLIAEVSQRCEIVRSRLDTFGDCADLIFSEVETFDFIVLVNQVWSMMAAVEIVKSKEIPSSDEDTSQFYVHPDEVVNCYLLPTENC